MTVKKLITQLIELPCEYLDYEVHTESGPVKFVYVPDVDKDHVLIKSLDGEAEEFLP